MTLSQEQPPEVLETELKEFLGRRFIDVSNELKQASKFPERKGMPYKPQFGDVHYFGDPSTHNYDIAITNEGWWGYIEIVPNTVPATGFWTKLNFYEEYLIDQARQDQDLVDYINTQTGIVMYGLVDDFIADVGGSTLVNYTVAGAWNGGLPADFDQVAGTIIIPVTGIWRATAFLTGNQGNALKEEQMWLGISSDASPTILSVYEVATDKTNSRTFSATVTRSVTAGTVLSLFGAATANLGTYEVVDVSFEVQRLL